MCSNEHNYVTFEKLNLTFDCQEWIIPMEVSLLFVRDQLNNTGVIVNAYLKTA